MNSLSSLKLELEHLIQREEFFLAYTKAKDIQTLTECLETQYKLGFICSKIGKISEAIKCFQSYIEKGGQDVFVNLNLGHMFKALGDFDQASAHYKNFISKSPSQSGHGYWHLSDLKDITIDEPTIKKMLKSHDSSTINDSNKMLINFALGNHYDRKGPHQKAFYRLGKANAFHSRKRPFNKIAFKKLTENLLTIQPSSQKHSNKNKSSPIFILGMPRSGSTLCEQILSRHSKVLATDELPFINIIAADLERTGNYAQTLANLSSENITQLQQYYLKESANYLSGSPLHFIDKNPTNFLHIGLILTLFPHAIIINTIRSVPDNAISIYKRFFSNGHEYAYSFDDINLYISTYTKIMQHWDNIFPGKIFHLHYESLVNEPQKNITALLKHCSLEHEEDCFEHHKKSQSVLTPSADQVNKPIYKTAVGSWEKYEALMDKAIVQQLKELDSVLKKMGGNSKTDNTPDAWSDYWQKGGLSSFGENYNGVFKEYWVSIAQKIKTNDKVLDLCTGNGAILNLIADNMQNDIQCRLLGVDFSIIKNLNKKIDLQGKVNIEALPFNDKSFNWVFSQFGIEYSNYALSAPELFRVLIPGGNFKIIAHHIDSVILSENKAIYQSSALLLKKSFPLFERMLYGLDLLAQGNNSGSLIASNAREKFNETMAENYDAFGDILFNTGFPEIMKNLLKEKGNTTKTPTFKNHIKEFELAQARLEQLFTATLDNQRKENFINTLKNCGLNITRSEPLTQKNTSIVGWIIEGHRPFLK